MTMLFRLAWRNLGRNPRRTALTELRRKLANVTPGMVTGY